jgi:hypothetical protein
MDKPAVRIVENRVGEQLEHSNRLPCFNQVLHHRISLFIVPPSSSIRHNPQDDDGMYPAPPDCTMLLSSSARTLDKVPYHAAILSLSVQFVFSFSSTLGASALLCTGDQLT